MKKILVVGDLSPQNRGYQWYKTFERLDCKVMGLSSESDIKLNVFTSLWHRVKNKLGYPTDFNGINEQIIESAESFKPDLIWIIKALMIKPSTLENAKRHNPNLKIISFTEDDMFPRFNQSHYYRAYLPFYDAVFTTKSYNCNPEELPSLGARKVILFGNSYNEQAHRPIKVNDKDRTRLGSDVGFLGTFEQDRGQKLLFLAKSGIKVRIWSGGWDNWIKKHPNLQIENKWIYFEDYAKSIAATKINLNFLRKINRDLQTSRSMEIPACGGFMLAERTSEHQELFEEDKEAVFFDINNPKELLEKARYYLEHEEERKAIAKAGRERCLKSGYSQHERLTWMLQQIFPEEKFL